MKFIVSAKKTDQGVLLVVTDEDIVGCYFEEGRKELDLRKDFYRGDLKGRKEVEDLFEYAVYIHLTGKAAVALGVERGLVSAKRVLIVAGVPHAEVVMAF